MSDMKVDVKEDGKENLAVSNVNNYPKNIQELTDYVSVLSKATKHWHRLNFLFENISLS